jgi:hypothetical protein
MPVAVTPAVPLQDHFTDRSGKEARGWWRLILGAMPSLLNADGRAPRFGGADAYTRSRGLFTCE